MGLESLLVPLIRDKSSSSRALTPLSSTPWSRKMLSGDAADVVDVDVDVGTVGVDDEFGNEAVVRCDVDVAVVLEVDVDEPDGIRCVDVGILVSSRS